MKTLIKNFYCILNRFKTSSIINIIGLAVGLAVFIVTMIQVDYDFSFNRSFRNAKDIYSFTSFWSGYDKRITNVSYPIMAHLAENYPEIDSYCLLINRRNKGFTLSEQNETSRFYIQLIETNEGFLDVFTPKVLLGDARQALLEPNKALITEDVAHLLFGKQNPIGKSIFPVENTGEALTVVAVCKKFPDNVSLNNGIYTYLKKDDLWGNYNYQNYLIIDKKEVPGLNKILNEDFLKSHLNNSEKLELIPFLDIHFKVPEIGKGNISLTMSLLAMGIVILIIALINYMNFSIAMIPSRLRSINIQKILGASPYKLKIMVASEAAFFCGFSFVISLFLVYTFGRISLSDYFSADLSIPENFNIIGITFAIAIGISFIMGLYPAYSVSSLQPALVINHSFIQSKKNVAIRNFLITVQFFAAIALIIISIFIKVQHNFMTNHSWGINKENVVYLNTGGSDLNPTTLFDELKNNPEIQDYTLADALPGFVTQGWGRNFGEYKVWFTPWCVQSNFLTFFGIEIIQGRSFLESDEGRSCLICNEAFTREYDLPDGVTGKKIEGSECGIIGVMKDMNFASLHNQIKPMCLVSEDTGMCPYFFLKISGNNIRESVEYIKETTKKLSGKIIEVHFLDQDIDNLYKKENKLAHLMSILGIIAISIAVMGAYGLILFNTKYKEKEIAIRKVNGSTIGEIIFLLNRSILLQLIMAFFIAIPVAYFIVTRWLESFAYKSPVYWWIFLLAGFIVFFITLLTISYQTYKAATENPANMLKNE